MELEADRMVNLVLTDEVVLPERDVVLEERRQRIENDPPASSARWRWRPCISTIPTACR